MKLFPQFLIILAFSFLGELVHHLLPFPIPASVYGIILLFIALLLNVVKHEQVNAASKHLISIMPILFVPPVVGILGNWAEIREDLLAVILLVAVSTVITFGISGRIAQRILKKG